MTDAERAAFQAILAEKVKGCEIRRLEEVRARDERIAELEKVNAGLQERVTALDGVVDWVAAQLARSRNCFVCPVGKCEHDWKGSEAICKPLIREAIERNAKKAGE